MFDTLRGLGAGNDQDIKLNMPNAQSPYEASKIAYDQLALSFYKTYKKDIIAAIPEDLSFTPLMTIYLTDNLSADVLERGLDMGVVFAAKLYPAGATTNSSKGVKQISKIFKLLLIMHEE